MNNSGEGFNRKNKSSSRKDYDSSSKGSGSNRKRQLNLSVRVREGKAMFKAAHGGRHDMNNLETMPRIESQMEEVTEMTDDRIESRLISDNRRHGNSSYLIGEGGVTRKSYYRPGNEEELRAVDQLQQTSEIALKKEQSLLNQLEQTKKNIASSQ